MQSLLHKFLFNHMVIISFPIVVCCSYTRVWVLHHYRGLNSTLTCASDKHAHFINPVKEFWHPNIPKPVWMQSVFPHAHVVKKRLLPFIRSALKLVWTPWMPWCEAGNIQCGWHVEWRRWQELYKQVVWLGWVRRRWRNLCRSPDNKIWMRHTGHQWLCNKRKRKELSEGGS